MADGDYIKLSRAILTWEWYYDMPVRILFIHILLNCRYQPGRWQGLELQPGQLPTSLPGLATGTGLSMQQVRTALRKLESTGEITDRSNNAFRLITVKNWGKWQGQPSSKRTGQQQASNRRATGEQQASNSTLRREEGKKGRSTPEGVRQQPVLPIDFGGADGSEAPPVSAPPPREDRRDPNVQAVIDHLTDKLAEKDLGLSLDGTVKENRFAAANLLRKLAKERPEHDPLESAKALIDFATSDEFHARNSTKVSYLFRNLAKLRNDAKAKRSATKSMTDDQYRESIKQAALEHFGSR